jgi:uncharacterized protein YjbJ (UPF0337 family)
MSAASGSVTLWHPATECAAAEHLSFHRTWRARPAIGGIANLASRLQAVLLAAARSNVGPRQDQPEQEGRTMNWEQVEGRWEQLKGRIRQKWGKLTDDDLDQAKGRRDELIGKIQARYGDEKDKAEKEVDRFISDL